jgi:hypothetical protein
MLSVLVSLCLVSSIRRCCRRAPNNLEKEDEFWHKGSPRRIVTDNAQCFSIATPRESPRGKDAKAAREKLPRLNLPSPTQEDEAPPRRGDMGGTSGEDPAPERERAGREEVQKFARLEPSEQVLHQMDKSGGRPALHRDGGGSVLPQAERENVPTQARTPPKPSPDLASGAQGFTDSPPSPPVRSGSRSGKVMREVQMLEATGQGTQERNVVDPSASKMRLKMEERRQRIENDQTVPTNKDPPLDASEATSDVVGRVTGPLVL